MSRSNLGAKDKIKRWDDIHERAGDRDAIRSQYNGWLEKPILSEILSKGKLPILDLGAGVGIDSLHLIEEGRQVIACDFSKVALEKIRQNIPQVQTRQVDMECPSLLIGNPLN